MPEPINLVDAAVFGKLKQLGIPASDVCDDATFLRRVSLDISGTLPSEEEVRLFLADASADKRDRLIDRLLDGTAYADHFANKWNFVLRNKRKVPTMLQVRCCSTNGCGIACTTTRHTISSSVKL
jgi:hypothetical protein